MKSIKFVLIAMLVLFAFAVGPVYAGSASESGYGNQDQSRMDQSTMMQGQQTFSANDMMGKTVNDQQGQEIGTVDDLVIGPQGQVEYVILAPTGDLAAEDHLIPLPWQIMQSQEGQENLTAAVDMQKLRDAPSISADQLQDLSGQEMQSRVQGYYGVEPQPGMEMQHQNKMMKQQEEMQEEKAIQPNKMMREDESMDQ